MLTSFLCNNRHFAAAAKEALRHVDRLPPAARNEILGALVTGALRGGDLSHAEELQIRLVESAGHLTPEMVRQAVITYRFNGNPALALVTIEQLEEQQGALPRDLRDLRAILASETSQPEMAFTRLTQRVRSAGDAPTLRRVIPQAVKAGIEAGKQTALIPLFEKYLQAVKATPATSDPLVSDYSMKLAQTYEVTNQASKAFDIYLDLAARGNRAALDRCFALNPGLSRREDLMKALVAGHQHYHDDDQLLRLTARYLGEAARREEAVRCYHEYLVRNPEDAEAHYLLGAVHDEGGRFNQALKHFKRACQLQPSNNTYLARLASLLATLGFYDEALERIRRLSKRTRDRGHAVSYHTLADGLGDPGAIKDSLRLLIEIGGSLSVRNHLDLASVHLEEGDLRGHLGVLQEALAKHPGNPFIRLNLANAHLFEKRPDRALDVLDGVDLTRDAQGARLAANAFGSLAQTRYAGYGKAYIQKFGTQLEASSGLTPLELLLFAEYCHQQGHTSRARRLFQRVVAEASEPGYLARAHFHLGHYHPARGYQVEHIRTSTRRSSHDYRLLGDIHTRLGDEDGARRAYTRALALVQKRTANPPGP